MIGPKEKKERALGERLGVKGDRCASHKCALVRKPYRPGAHGQSRKRRNQSEYGLQIKEKQKFKISYGIDERNLRRIFASAAKFRGSSSEKIMELLERRLDNVVFRLGFAPSRYAARNLIVQGHIAVNGKRVRSPGFEVSAKDRVGIAVGSESILMARGRADVLKKWEPPSWIHLDKDKMEGEVVSLPQGVESPFQVSLLVESFSK